MKKLLFILIASVISFSAMAQLNVQSSSTKDDIIEKNARAVVKLTKNGYVVSVDDWLNNTNSRLELFLGETKEAAVLTINDILQWHESAKNKDNITVKDAITEQDLTLYRYNGTVIMLSTGDAEYIRKGINSNIGNAMLGGPKKKTHSDSPICGQIMVSLLRKAVEKLK